MPDLLLELLTEEIPARMQKGAGVDLHRLVTEKLDEAGLGFAQAEIFVTPRRLALSVAGLPLAQQDVSEERRGPRVGAPAPAIAGFLKSAGLATIAECEERDTGKGNFYFATIRRPGRPTAQVLAELLRAAIDGFPWPKSMRFPAAAFRWVRPITSVVALFDGEVLPLALDDVPVGDETRGHRFLSPAPFRVQDFAEYREKLAAAHVVLDPAERERIISEGLARTAQGLGVRLKDDPALLEEVTGLVEWPVVLAGRIDAAFMDLPAEVLTTSMRSHQKYFATLDAGGALAPHFLLVANMAAADGGKAIVAGNERVLRARLSDARFFWDQDRKVPLAARVPKLAERVFHAKLGSVLDKVERVVQLSDEIASRIGADRRFVERAAKLSKADLSTGMVGEFPELQGIMGRYYAVHDGEPLAVADAIAEHYSPIGPSDRCPSSKVSVAVALADKIDTLYGFFSNGELPTGSKDPFALRRAALGVIRIILENRLRIPLRMILLQSQMVGHFSDATGQLLSFIAERLIVELRGKGVRHDLIKAVFSTAIPRRGHGAIDYLSTLEDDLTRLLARVNALQEFLRTYGGSNLLVAYRRASNIVRIEEKKDSAHYGDEPNHNLFEQDEEYTLATRLDIARLGSIKALLEDDFTGAMEVFALLRQPVDEFFERVTVNCDDPKLRTNRLRLLARIQNTLNIVADFSLIEG